jgi:hypothetical protein
MSIAGDTLISVNSLLSLTNSSNSISISDPEKFLVKFLGISLTMTGWMVSLGPPVGDWTLAHDIRNKEYKNTIPGNVKNIVFLIFAIFKPSGEFYIVLE